MTDMRAVDASSSRTRVIPFNLQPRTYRIQTPCFMKYHIKIKESLFLFCPGLFKKFYCFIMHKITVYIIQVYFFRYTIGLV